MCRYNYIVFSVLILFSSAILVTAQSNAVSRCFQYTWLGPSFNNESVFLNATCQDVTNMAEDVPCRRPLIATKDGTWPDIEYIWINYLLEASCVLADNDVCATYTYYFNGFVENSTSMCTRAIDAYGAAIRSGCYTQVDGSYETTVCFCRPVPGGMPCNNAILPMVTPTLLAILTATLLLQRWL